MGLRVRGETVDEIAGAARAMRAKVLKVRAPDGAIDTCGTGGDGKGTFNISTCAAFVVAGAGVPVAKHGNRAISSRSGSADVLKELGVNIEASPETISRCIAECGLGFMFAPAHHAAMRHVAQVRTELGTRTIFNLLGPLANPAGTKFQIIGVFGKEWVEPIAQVLALLGTVRAWVVHGSDGLDELTTTGISDVAVLDGGKVSTFEISPRNAGLPDARAGGSRRRRCGGERRPYPRRAWRQARAVPRYRAAECRRGAARRGQGEDAARGRGAGLGVDRQRQGFGRSRGARAAQPW